MSTKDVKFTEEHRAVLEERLQSVKELASACGSRFARQQAEALEAALSALPPAESKLQLRVGGKYRSRQGDVVEITAWTESAIYPFVDEGGNTYAHDGRWKVGDEVCLDLIAEVSESAMSPREAYIAGQVACGIKVGDCVRLNRVGSTFHSTCGTVKQTNADGDFRVEFGSRGGGWFAGDLLIKQIRKIEPYTIDQCIAEIAIRESRGVMRGGETTEIVTIYSNGVSTDKPHSGFISYAAAAKAITWPNGDAFGTVTWRDAE